VVIDSVCHVVQLLECLVRFVSPSAYTRARAHTHTHTHTRYSLRLHTHAHSHTHTFLSLALSLLTHVSVYIAHVCVCVCVCIVYIMCRRMCVCLCKDICMRIVGSDLADDIIIHIHRYSSMPPHLGPFLCNFCSLTLGLPVPSLKPHLYPFWQHRHPPRG